MSTKLSTLLLRTGESYERDADMTSNFSCDRLSTFAGRAGFDRFGQVWAKDQYRGMFDDEDELFWLDHQLLEAEADKGIPTHKRLKAMRILLCYMAAAVYASEGL